MIPKLQYLVSVHVAVVAALSGFVLANNSEFLVLFFDSNFFDKSIFISLFLISGIVSYTYLKVQPILTFFISIVFLVSLILIQQIQNVVILYPDVLIGLIYLTTLVAGSALALSIKLSRLNHPKLEHLILIFLFGIGAFLNVDFGNRGWVAVVVSIDLLLLFVLQTDVSKAIKTATVLTACLIISLSFISSTESKKFESQNKFNDQVIFSTETAFQKIDVTSWKKNQWFYFDGINQYSTIDAWLYYEPLVHPVLQLSQNRKNVLVIGGENGIVARELRKYTDVEFIDILPIDTGYFQLAQSNPIFTKVNQNSLLDKKVSQISSKALRHLQTSEGNYNVIIVDAPDPLDLEINQYYTKEFYQLCYQALKPDGYLITQAGSPYYATKAFYGIQNTLKKSGFETVPIHNQVITLGEWGWIIGSKSSNPESLIKEVSELRFDNINTRWINNEAMRMMMSFGKPYQIVDTIEINTFKNPVIHNYYTQGTWNF